MLKDFLMTLDTSKCLELWNCLGKQHLDRTLVLISQTGQKTYFRRDFLTHCRPLFVSFLALVLPALYILEPALVVKRKTQTVSKESSALTQGDTRHYCSMVFN